MTIYKSWKQLVPIFLLSMFMGLLGVIGIFVNLFKYGYKKAFKVIVRNVKPDIIHGNAYGEHKFIRLKNHRTIFHCVVKGSKNKPMMLLLHGFPDFWLTWRYQIEEFSNDYYTVAIDMKGFGESSKPQSISSYAIETLVNEIDELITLLGYKSCTILGHDWGGAIAWFLVNSKPERVDKLVALNIPHPLAFRKLLYSSMNQLIKSWYMFLFQIPFLPVLLLRSNDLHILSTMFKDKRETGIISEETSSYSLDITEAYKYNFNEWNDFSVALNYYKAAMLYYTDNVLFDKKISVPSHIIWGCKDVALEKEMATMSEPYVENFSYKYVEEAGHWVHVEYPKEVNASIRQFLNSN